jgi:hypothetical protein
MRNKKFWGLIGLMLVIGMVLIGCENGTTDDDKGSPTKFEGKWMKSGYGYIFKNNDVTTISPDYNPSTPDGTFEFTETVITFTYPNQKEPTVTADYTLNGNTLHLSNYSDSSGSDWVGDFTKE